MTSPEKDNLSSGIELINHAQRHEHAVKYGRITQMFPFVYQASQKMGIRALSRQLDVQGTPISHATISRALNDPEPHWEGFWEILAPHARRVSEKYALPMSKFLFDDASQFENLVKELPRIVDADDETVIHEAEETEASADFLRGKWFPLYKATRAHCRRLVEEEEGK